MNKMFAQIGFPNMDEHSIREEFKAYDKDFSCFLDKREFSTFCRQMFETLLISTSN